MMRALMLLGLATALALAGCVGCLPATGWAETPFDGTWRGESINEVGRCPPRYDIFLTISDGRIKGRMVSRRETLTVSSSVDPGGRVEQVFAYNGRTILKTGSGSYFGPERATIYWTGHSLHKGKQRGRDTCDGVITLERR